MATKKKAKAEGPKTFPKEQGEDGAPDRFVPPDRQDQIPNEDGDRPQVIQLKDLSEGLEVVESEDDQDDEAPEGQEEEDRRAADSDGVAFEDDEEEQEERPRQRGRYSKRVLARVNRERALKEQQRVRADNAERRARSVEERLAKLERVNVEVSGDQNVKALEAKIAGIQKDLGEAIEKGDTAKQLDLTIKLGDAQGDLRFLKHDLEQKKKQVIEDEAKRKEELEKETAGDADEGAQVSDDDSRQDYLEANKRWWKNPQFSRQKTVALALDADILQEINNGALDVERYSDEHFEILNERLAELFPNLQLKNTDGSDFDAEPDQGEEDETVKNRDRNGSRSTERRPPVGGQGTRSNGRRQQTSADLARQGKVRLDQADYTQMRMYGLDPNKPEHKKAFAKERMRTILTEDRRNQRGAR